MLQDVFELGLVPYAAADPLEKVNWYKKCMFLIFVLLDIVKVLVLSVPNWITSAYHCIVSPPRKCVTGQTVLITGGGNGIGKALAFKLAEKGCMIAIADIEWNAAKATAKALQAINVIAKAYQVDVANADQIKELKNQIEKDIGPVDILINNAGIIPLLSLREGSEIEIERIVQVNITSQFFVTRTFLPGMITRKRGHIVAISSISAVHPMPGAVIYTSTKCAVNGFMQALYQELRQEGNDFINLTSVLPYFVSTRKDLMAAVDLRFPALSAEEAAEVIVDSTLRNEQIISVPRSNLWIRTLANLLSMPNQCLIRDHVLKEKETRKLFYKEKQMSNSSYPK